MLLGRLRRTALADQEDCRAWGAWGAWDLADGVPTPSGAPEVLDIVVEPRRLRRRGHPRRGAPRRRQGAVERSCRPDGSCLCCTCGLLTLVIFAVLARQLMSKGLEDGTGLRLRGSNDTGWSGNLSENGSTIYQNFTGSGGFAHGDSVSSHQEEDLESHSADSTLYTLDSPRDSPVPWNGTEDVAGWNTSDQNASNDTTDGENLSSADESEAAMEMSHQILNRSEGNLTEIQGSSNVSLTTLMTSNFLAEANTTGPAGRSTTRTSTTRYVAGEVLVNSTVSSTLSWSFAVSNPENLSTSTTETTGWQATTISSRKRTTTTTTTTATATATATATIARATTTTTAAAAAITTTSRSTNSSSSTTSTTTSATGTTSAVSNTSTITTATASASTSTTTTTSTITTTTTTIIITSTASTTSTVSTTTTSNISSTVSSTITTSSTITASTTSITSLTSTISTTRTGTTSTTSTRTGTASTTSRISSTSTATATTHPDTLTTTTTARFRHRDFHFQASGPLAAMPNCYLAPLVEKPGCQRILVEEGPQFGLNDLGQETTARRLCLERARELGNSWVFRLQRCEVWNCTSLTALQRSADSGPPDDGVLLQDARGRILTTGKEHEVVAEDHYVASLALVLEPLLQNPSVLLRSADGHYVTEAAGGSLEASGNRETGLLFNVTREDGGWVSLRHPLGRRLRCNGRCTLGDAAATAQLFRLMPSEALREAWSAKTSGDGRAWVHSQLCNYQEPYGGEGGRQRRSASYVKLWEWNYADVQEECREILGPAGVDAVQLSPVTEHILGHQWWVRYQPISASLNSRSGSAEQLREAVAECRKAGVEVIVDVVLNHMARPCAAAQGKARGTPCEGWNGTSYGNRRTAGAHGWDMATPQHFHHGDKEIWGECGVGPDTGFLCGSPVTTDCSCCPCDMYGLPDWNLAVKAVQESHTRHLEELHHMGVTMLRIDAALYMEPALMSSILNRFPWDVVYQEWWHELPLPGRTDVFGLYRDLKFMRRVSEFLAVQDISRTQEVLDVDRGDFFIHPVEAVYPTCFHDGRSDEADPAIPTFKNGLAFHQQQLFLLASPFPVTVVLWGGYAWRSIDDGPPGCEGGQSRCAATSPQSAGCQATPTTSPLEVTATARPWICEHRWQGVAGLLRFRSHCRDAETQRWTPGGPEDLRLGHLAFRLGSRCFVALARGSAWSLADRPLETGLPAGRYCDLASFDGRTCHREVLLGRKGRVLKGGVAAGHLLAISAAVMQP